MSNGIVSSITRAGAYEPFDVQVSRTQIAGHQSVNINGYNASVAGTQIPLWENATAYTFPSTALTMTIASSSATDVSPAAVTISGLDANWNQISETIVLTGTTGVATTNKYLRINSLTMVGVASGQESNVGTITAKNGGTTYGQINATLGRSQMSIYSIPAGYTGYLRRINCWCGSLTLGTNWILYNFFAQTNGINLSSAQISFFQDIDVHRYCPSVYQQKTDLVWTFSSSDSSNQHVAMYAELLLIKNDNLVTGWGT